MKRPLLLFAVAISASCVFAQGTTNFHDYSARSILGDNIDFSQYHGKKVMVVNTASYCGFTPQFDDLQNLYEQYQQYDFEIIGFPCNDFDNQDPHNDSTILEFCTSNYGVTFQMMSRIIAVEPDTAPVFRWLQEVDLNGVTNAPITWNFHKFLIDEAGDWVAHHGSTVSPMASSITNWIMSPSVLAGVEDPLQPDALALVSLGSNHSAVELKVNSVIDGPLDISIYSVNGMLVDRIYTGNTTVGQTIGYSTLHLPLGSYLIRAASEEGQQTIRYMVVR